jgi:hypothetical protein
MAVRVATAPPVVKAVVALPALLVRHPVPLAVMAVTVALAEPVVRGGAVVLLVSRVVWVLRAPVAMEEMAGMEVLVARRVTVVTVLMEMPPRQTAATAVRVGVAVTAELAVLLVWLRV